MEADLHDSETQPPAVGSKRKYYTNTCRNTHKSHTFVFEGFLSPVQIWWHGSKCRASAWNLFVCGEAPVSLLRRIFWGRLSGRRPCVDRSACDEDSRARLRVRCVSIYRVFMYWGFSSSRCRSSIRKFGFFSLRRNFFPISNQQIQ